MQDFFSRVGAWCAAHPELVWPLLTALITLLFKPRTPAEYAQIAVRFPRVAAGLQLIGALGLDVPKVVEAVHKVVTGRSDPPRKPPAGPSIMAIGLVAVIASTWSVIACHGLNDADRAELARDGVRIGVCKSLASDCGEDAGEHGKNAPQCWKVFDDCLADAGITITHAKDGGR